MRSFRESFNMLTEAYIRGEVDPWDCKACFVGNLLGGTDEWTGIRTSDMSCAVESGKGILKIWIPDEVRCSIHESTDGTYTPKELVDLEANFVYVYSKQGGRPSTFSNRRVLTEEDEDALFKAFESTLELLKKIHISKGEDVDNQMIPEFKKRSIVEKV